MTENLNQTQTPETAPVQEQPEGAAKSHRDLFPTLEEAQGTPAPEGTKLRIYQIFQDGVSLGFTWGSSPEVAIAGAARIKGFTASVAEPKAAVTKDLIASRLASFSDEELAALGLSRKTEKKGKKKTA